MSYQIPEEYFDPEAPLEQRSRMACPCSGTGKSKSLDIMRVDHGWVWYCHRHREGGFKPAAGLSPSDMVKWIASRKLKPTNYRREVELPPDSTEKIPPRGLVWLMKYDIHQEEIRRFRFEYSPGLDRLIMPVYEKGELVFWIGRLLSKPDKDNPKYSSVQGPRKDIYFKARPEVATSHVTIVEDILSAIKVGRQVESWAMLFATMTDDVAMKLKDRKVHLWLDPDKKKRSLELGLRFRSLGIDVHTIYSDKDPKYYNDKEVREWLRGI